MIFHSNLNTNMPLAKYWPSNDATQSTHTHAQVLLPSVPPLSLPSEEQIIIIIIIIVTIQRPTPVFQAKLKQSETA